MTHPSSVLDAARPASLRHQVLSPIETLGQSISTIAPSTSPPMTIPLVFAVAGNGTWLAYLLATVSVLLVALCIRGFARDSASPGSLYSYATSTLPPSAAAVTAWALLLAYIATGSSVAGGFVNYGIVLLEASSGGTLAHALPTAVCLALFVCALSIWIAYRDVRLSARLMLWIEGSSVLLIAIVLGAILLQGGWHFDPQQLRLRGASTQGVRLGMVLALFSFVGFESATALGAEAREPLRSIPRAVLQSALLCGVFFILAAYSETLGYRPAGNLADTTAPFHVLAARVGMPFFGPLVDLGVLISMFAATLGCLTAGARVLLRMATDGLTHRHLGRVHPENQTPATAVLAVGILICLPTVVLAARGTGGADIYGWMGSLATYGFITVYALVAIALPIALRRKHRLRAPQLLLALAATAAMLLALEGSLYPVPPRPYSWLPYLYLGYLAAALAWSLLQRRRPASTRN